MTSGSRFSWSFMSVTRFQQSAAAHGDHDFQLVSVDDLLFRMAAAGHDLAVALERDTLAGEVELREQLGAIERRLQLARLAVDGDGDHGRDGLRKYCRRGIVTPCPVFCKSEAQAGRDAREPVAAR